MWVVVTRAHTRIAPPHTHTNTHRCARAPSSSSRRRRRRTLTALTTTCMCMVQRDAVPNWYVCSSVLAPRDFEEEFEHMVTVAVAAACAALIHDHTTLMRASPGMNYPIALELGGALVFFFHIFHSMIYIGTFFVISSQKRAGDKFFGLFIISWENIILSVELAYFQAYISKTPPF